MGVDTDAYFPYIKLNDFVSVVKNLYDDVSLEETYNFHYHSLIFLTKNTRRNMSVYESIIDSEKETEIEEYLKSDKNHKYTEEMSLYSDSRYRVNSGLPDKTWGIYASLSYNDLSVSVMKTLACLFNGYVDENDCDENDFVQVTDKDRIIIIKSII